MPPLVSVVAGKAHDQRRNLADFKPRTFAARARGRPLVHANCLPGTLAQITPEESTQALRGAGDQGMPRGTANIPLEFAALMAGTHRLVVSRAQVLIVAGFVSL